MKLQGAGEGGRTVVQCLDCGCWAFDDEQDGKWHSGPDAEYERAVAGLVEASETLVKRLLTLSEMEDTDYLGDEGSAVEDAISRIRSLFKGASK